jgi:small-conductance mechanosensitive channel
MHDWERMTCKEMLREIRQLQDELAHLTARARGEVTPEARRRLERIGELRRRLRANGCAE